MTNELLARIGLLEKENQELKSQLSGTTHCFDEEEHRELKDKIKELERVIELCHLDAKETLATINYEQESQQKEFINYLEDEISKQKNDIFANALTSEDIDLYIMKIKLQELEEILQKYKETIQTKNDKFV